MMNYLNNVTETKPLIVGATGVAGGAASGTLYWLKLAGEVAGSVGAILGAIVATLSMILLIKQIRKKPNA